MEPTFTFKEKVWLWQGKAAWHFVNIPKDISAQIKSFNLPRKGFGSVRVKATIGSTEWKTSIFPSKKDKIYILPLKSAVRKSEKINAKDIVEITIVTELDI